MNPNYQEILDWFAEVYNIHITSRILPRTDSNVVKYHYRVYNKPLPLRNIGFTVYESLHEAIISAIKYTIS